MAELVTPSPQVAFIAWAKGNAAIATEIGTKISAKLPTRGLTYPWVEVTRITGVPQLPEVPMDYARLQISVWGGRKANGLPDWDKADRPARVIAAEVRGFKGMKVNDDAFIAQLAPFEGMQQLEDPETHGARFWMDVLCIVRRADGQ